ncbi:MAG: sigma factor, partial [Phycisphaerae bacterium]
HSSVYVSIMAKSSRRTRRDRRPDARGTAPERELSGAQREQTTDHVGLVRLQLSRQSGVSHRSRTDRDAEDLYQEGCLALVRAVRDHDPSRHGSFGPYALARIHHAMSRQLFERDGGIRVPMTTQRRLQRRAGDERHQPRRQIPREVTMDFVPQTSDRCDPRSAPDGRDGQILTHLVFERFSHLAHRVTADMNRAPGARNNRRSLITHCLEGRWLVPEADSRTSLREIAAASACSLGRVTHYEADFKRRIARAVADDRPSQWLAELAHGQDDGFRHVLDTEEVRRYRETLGPAGATAAALS